MQQPTITQSLCSRSKSWDESRTHNEIWKKQRQPTSSSPTTSHPLFVPFPCPLPSPLPPSPSLTSPSLFPPDAPPPALAASCDKGVGACLRRGILSLELGRN